MSLAVASVVAGAILLIIGIYLWTYSEKMRHLLQRFPRSKPATFVLLVAASAIVLVNVSQLGEADFGKYKEILMVFFALLAVGAWFTVPDFLGIRALSVLGLLFAGQLLSAAYFEPYDTKFFLALFAYFVVVVCLYLAAAPYRVRDWIDKINGAPKLRRIVALVASAYGALLCLLALTFTG
ncbi:MAG: hypothetical protein AAGJ81_07740 [Verrucomicrobiota bacterium]